MRIKQIAGIICCAILLSGCGQSETTTGIVEFAQSLDYFPESRASYPILNMADDNPLIGDEEQFLRIAKQGKYGSAKLEDYQTDRITVQPGESYVVMVYYHNNADPELGDAGYIRNPMLTLSFPEELKAGDEGVLSALFSYEGENSTIRGDQIYLTSKQDLRLETGYALPQDDPPGVAMWTNYNCSIYAGSTPSEMTLDGITAQFYAMDDIAPGYENAGMFFIVLEVVAAD